MLFNIFLAIHILGGSIGLLSGTWNLVARKGGDRHRAVGRVFVVAMLATGLSALVLATLRPNPFLFMVGVLTLYLVGTGRLRLKRDPTATRGPAASSSHLPWPWAWRVWPSWCSARSNCSAACRSARCT